MKFSKPTVYIFGMLGAALLTVPIFLAGLQLAEFNFLYDVVGKGMGDNLLYSQIMRYVFQVPGGIFICLFFYYIHYLFPPEHLLKFGFRSLLYFCGVSSIILGVFPCDAGCVDLTFGLSVSQGINFMTEGLTYLFFPFILFVLALGFRRIRYVRTSQAINILGLFTLLMVFILYKDQSFAGLLQRIIKLMFITFAFGIAYMCKVYNPLKVKKVNFN